jgi:hypothetical protein
VKQFIKNSPHANTLFNGDWLIQNHDKLINLMPETWTHVDNLDFMNLGLTFDMLGVHWETKNDIFDILNFFHSVDMIKIKNGGYHIIRNENNPIADAISDIKSF